MTLGQSAVCLQSEKPCNREIVWSPQSGTSRDLRHAFGRFATGITVITVQSSTGPYGMTVNSFSSVSLDPALILWSVDKASARCSTFREASHFAVNILNEDQASVALEFARNPHGFDTLVWHRSESDLPLIDGCVANFQCEREAIHEGGDHLIVVGKVIEASATDALPLLFYRGEFDRTANDG